MDARVRELLASHAWPGNVRELENVVRAATAAAGEGEEVREEHLPQRVRGRGNGWTLREAVRAFEREQLRGALRAEGGNRTRAARILGISRQALSRKLRGMETP